MPGAQRIKRTFNMSAKNDYQLGLIFLDINTVELIYRAYTKEWYCFES
jgi:hypothetical protein